MSAPPRRKNHQGPVPIRPDITIDPPRKAALPVKPVNMARRARVAVAFALAVLTAVAGPVSPVIAGAPYLGGLVTFGVAWGLYLLVFMAVRRYWRTAGRAARRHSGRAGRAGWARAQGLWADRAPAQDPPVPDQDQDEEEGNPVSWAWPKPPGGESTQPVPIPVSPAPGVRTRGPAPRRSGGLRIAAGAGGVTSAGWVAVVTEMADLDPDSDEEYLDQTGAHVIGMGSYAEACIEAWETMARKTGVDPEAIRSLLTFADIIAEAADRMADSRREFARFYAEERANAASGKIQPRDGRWITGGGEA